jgi:hypothetical protein
LPTSARFRGNAEENCQISLQAATLFRDIDSPVIVALFIPTLTADDDSHPLAGTLRPRMREQTEHQPTRFAVL